MEARKGSSSSLELELWVLVRHLIQEGTGIQIQKCLEVHPQWSRTLTQPCRKHTSS